MVEKQREAGIDVGNNGEQQRDSFFSTSTTGLGGSWERPARADVDRYPEFKRDVGSSSTPAAPRSRRSAGCAKAIGEVRISTVARSRRSRYFAAVLLDHPGVFVEPFMSAPSPGILATAVKNEHYHTLDAYLAALGRALQVEYEAIARHGFLLQIDAPDLALERHITYKDEPVALFVDFVERVVATINAAIANVPRHQVRLHVCWGNSESLHDADVPLADILPALP